MKKHYAAVASLLVAHAVPAMAQAPRSHTLMAAAPTARPDKHVPAANNASGAKYVAAPPAHVALDSERQTLPAAPPLLIPEASGNAKNWMQGGGG